MELMHHRKLGVCKVPKRARFRTFKDLELCLPRISLKDHLSSPTLSSLSWGETLLGLFGIFQTPIRKTLVFYLRSSHDTQSIMRFLDFLYPAALALCAFADDAQAWKKKDDSVLLSKVKSLTLRSGQKTTHRRVSAIPQLRCTGGSGKGLYEVDVLRCKNQGSDYDDEK